LISTLYLKNNDSICLVMVSVLVGPS